MITQGKLRVSKAEMRLIRMLERKRTAMRVEKERLNRLEKNVKHLAKKLGVGLK